MIEGSVIINRSTGKTLVIDNKNTLSSADFREYEICLCSDDEPVEGDVVININTGRRVYVETLGGILGYEGSAGFMYIKQFHKKLESSGSDTEMIMELSKNMKPYLAEHVNRTKKD